MLACGSTRPTGEGSISVPSRACVLVVEVNRLEPGKDFLFQWLETTAPPCGQATGAENIGPERPLRGLPAAGPVNSPSCITTENNGKIRPQPDQENAFARANGGERVCDTRNEFNGLLLLSQLSPRISHRQRALLEPSRRYDAQHQANGFGPAVATADRVHQIDDEVYAQLPTIIA